MKRYLGKSFRELQGEQRQRERDLVAQAKADRIAESDRRRAMIELEDGSEVAIREIAEAPPAAQLVNGTFETFTPRLGGGSVATVTAYRRVDMVQVRKMLLGGTIDHEGYRACGYYRDLFEMTGLSGAIPSIDYGKEVFAAPHSRSLFSDRQVEAQDEFNAVRRLITTRWLPLLDAIVLSDIPYYRAEKLIRQRKGKGKVLFGLAVVELVAAREAVKP